MNAAQIVSALRLAIVFFGGFAVARDVAQTGGMALFDSMAVADLTTAIKDLTVAIRADTASEEAQHASQFAQVLQRLTDVLNHHDDTHGHPPRGGRR
ncbi:hypothetical protein [Methylobacterium sp. R2-1]|uniref:hypothetical protein n=1 Tax=Methylobacterium sp. R2-1 TaxID=2587064 RepID=UPI0017AE8B3A|nr:hypothetical protein [Methylobacterium sp. R2-1]MBB2964689.1 hypothetical protein [Methylobacterium sp. R2-1]